MDCSRCGTGPLAADLVCVACRAATAPFDTAGAGDPDAPSTASAARAPGTDRRDPQRQRVVVGGSRGSDPPLTTRDIATLMSVSTGWVRAAIDEGVIVRGRIVKLEAEVLEVNGRRIYRIHNDRLRPFLKAIGWSRLPPDPRGASNN